MFVRSFLSWFTSVFLNAIALIAVSQLFDSFYIADFKTALIASVILSVLNLIVRPILIILTLPITVLTLGFFILIINAITLMLAQKIMGDSFVINGFGVAFIASIIISLISMFLHRLVGDVKEK
ncbi:phage holin family protein [Pseudogracilibacillus auburnensis]|uniref:Putative membrane protein n=1 Tax=Pseudogracilibacillus auburnensis TaxID=1494959 RepID=A0A2V3W936_9BACI|nr:phage holin family protein [Pseudogracilibacillus auburnensis]MBO1001567.1 phage holin family protein [Pseudogracilibacillus auburnensis]PXW89511.1 putative membrane protein [Pseudogracilibacillus auburnensis]